jgi:chromosome segregation protein
MLLNKLELLGFKSFPQKLKIEFGPGITCIVGPNGCGKTNIADAIRWALGEQSAKALRGGNMGDVIFGGTTNRKPLGMAEVTLSFSNSKSLIPLEYDEIAVNRRVFRNGVSEYSLNKTPCRLKDIKDVFFDTGIGSHAYSLIEQEMVDHVLSDNSGHRRFLFEEAAGITKYKTRKREALLKLDATENDLLRVNDILVEIERETNSLRRQIARARRFKRLETEIKELDVNLAILTYNQYDEEVKKLSAEQETCLAKKGRHSGVISTLEASLEKLKFEIIEKEEKVTEAGGEVAEVEERQATIKDRILVLKERRTALDSRRDGITEDIRHIEDRAQTAERRSDETANELASLDDAIAARRQEIGLKEEGHASKEKELLKAKNDIQALDEHVSEAKTEETQRTSKLDELAAMKGEIETQLSATNDEIAQLEAELAKLRTAKEAQSEALTHRRARLAELETEIGENEARQTHLDKESNESRERETTLTGDARTIEGRLSALENVATKHREKRELIHEALIRVQGGVPGLLEELVDIPDDLARAFDTILGEYGPIVVVDDRETALSCFATLDKKIPGRFSILSLEETGEVQTGAHPSSPISAPGVVGDAMTLVGCPEKLRSALRSILEGTIIIETAEALHDKRVFADQTAKLVTRDGRLACRGRTFVGGKTSHSGGAKSEKELAENRKELEKIRRMLSECSNEASSLKKERDEATERGRRLSTEMAELKVGISSEERAISVCVAEMKILENRMNPAREKGRNLEERLRSYNEQTENLKKEISRLHVSLAPKSERFDAQSSLVTHLEAQREAILVDLGELRMAEVREHARRNELLSLTKRLAEERQLLVAEVERKRTTLEETKTARASAEEELGELEGRALEVAEIDKVRVTKLEEARASFNSLRKEASNLEEQVRTERGGLEQLSEEAHHLELSLTRQKIEREGIARRIHADYGTDLTVVSPPSDDFNPPEAEERLAIVREKLRNLGPVNLLALEEFEKKKERLDFIRSQRDDLIQAKSSLLEVIEKINERAASLFLQTYNSVQQKFRETFRTLFEGGDAELRLLGEDPLEGEIEIVARPRGKSLQSLNLLSGGERALTAIALLFALYLVKPSPFCILDEVDAPLDDANINRFLGMLKMFNERTQFIVITHNKRTMEAADCLYGITMQEPGISRVVSVKLSGANEPEELVEEVVGVES